MSKANASNTLLLRRQLAELTKHPVEGFSAGKVASLTLDLQRLISSTLPGLVDDDNLYEWEILIIGFVSMLFKTLEGCCLQGYMGSGLTILYSMSFSLYPMGLEVTVLFASEGGFFKARLLFPPEFPLLPPKMRFITPMWHPNS